MPGEIDQDVRSDKRKEVIWEESEITCPAGNQW